jgi:hypothetical protein
MKTTMVSSTNIRVNLTDIISSLDSEHRVAVTKHGKVIAYLVAPAGFNGIWAPSTPVEPAVSSPGEEASPEVQDDASNDGVDFSWDDDLDEAFTSPDELPESYGSVENHFFDMNENASGAAG